ncbi:hypothetical protein SAMN05428949_4618 [Chitinophaga sp. YR627]|uniref:hypothetical protein n=1 Tax=Chitinophaga sp. YR627 TaxID=1881041 RepID=UPI0008EEF2F7|nr:hypothetical protein [Chitinophaga sp. YR627]SFO24079.1 hypothetical protein SAMN05428949_4618 [Chitinophaga sp. YR627]
MSAFDSLAEWFTNSGRTLPKKLAVAVIILFGAFTVNDLLGFAYFYRTDKKVESFEKLTKIIVDTTTDATSRVKAELLREEIMCRQPVYFSFLNIFGKFWRSMSEIKKTTIPRTTTTTKIAANASIRNEFMFFVSSSGIYAIIGVLLVLAHIFVSRQPVIQRIAAIILMSLLIFFVTTAMYFLTNLIPVLFSDWAYNYMLNAILQAGSIILWLVLGHKL